MKFQPYKRSERVSQEIYQIVLDVCRNELSDPRLKGVQLTSAVLTDDLQTLKVYYYIEGSSDGQKRVEKGLASAKGYFKRAIAERADLRLVPDILFFFDDGIEKAERLDTLLGNLKQGRR